MSGDFIALEGKDMETHNITWRGDQIEITFTPEKFGMTDHIELRTEARHPLPVTEQAVVALKQQPYCAVLLRFEFWSCGMTIRQLWIILWMNHFLLRRLSTAC